MMRMKRKKRREHLTALQVINFTIQNPEVIYFDY